MNCWMKTSQHEEQTEQAIHLSEYLEGKIIQVKLCLILDSRCEMEIGIGQYKMDWIDH